MIRSFRRAGALVALLALLLVSVSTPAPAGTPAVVDRETGLITDMLSSYERVDLDASDAVERVRAGQPLRIATPTLAFDVRLVEHDIRSADCVVQVTHAGGVVERVDPGPVTTYRGTVDGMPGAEARFKIDEDGVEGVILTDDAWWFVEPETSGLAKQGGRGAHVVYADHDVLPQAGGMCGTTQAHELEGEIERLGGGEKTLGGLPPLPPRTELATEADYEYFRILDGVTKANNEIASIVNQVDGVYQKQIGVSFEIVFQNVWDTREDPYDSTDAGERLGEFRSYWNSNQAGVRRDLTHFWTGAPIDGSVLGVAFVGVICTSASASYGLSGHLGNAPSKFILTAHEIGHNFGGRHPDQAVPPRTECDNTIMQSFVGSGFKFCRYSRDQIEAQLASSSACLRNNRVPVAAAGPDRFAGPGDAVTLLGGGSSDADGDVLTYRWAQTSGPSVTLNGSATSTAIFATPTVGSETALTFALTTTDGRGGSDQDDVAVTIVPGELAGITVTSPAAGAAPKVGKNLKIRFAVEAPLTGTVLIELSRNGGTTFETIADGVSATAGRWKWKITGPKTTAALVRITSTSDTRSQGFSSVFAID